MGATPGAKVTRHLLWRVWYNVPRVLLPWCTVVVVEDAEIRWGGSRVIVVIV
jgi:hypothetical protein